MKTAPRRSILILVLLFVIPQLTHGQTLPRCTRGDRWALSDVASAVLTNIESNPTAQFNSTVPLSKILSTCNRFDSLRVDGPNIYAAARDLIVQAKHEVDIAFFHWEATTKGADLIGDGLITAQARHLPSDPLLVRIVIDDWDSPVDLDRAVNHLYDSQKRWVARGLDLSRVTLQFGTSPRSTPASPNLHDKIVVIDGRLLLVTGSQPQATSDPYSPDYASGWHDSGYVFEGDAARSALAAFEHTWTGDAIHWQCSPQTLSHDCDSRATHFPQPLRSWMTPYGTQAPGNVPLLAVGRVKGGTFDNDTNNPQDLAWMTVMDHATSTINVESPNINDDAFRAAVVRAIGRGVTVHLITSLGFNDFSADLPSQGGDNMEVVGNLRKEIRATYPALQDHLQVRWYSKDGIEAITGNGSWASHTKYMTMDGRVAIVGSGNMDTAAWNISHEFNVLIDDPAVTSVLDATLFNPDWSRAITNYLELYEGNNASQDVVCPITIVADKTVKFGDPIQGSDYRCDNDEARSLLLHDVPAGKVFRFYDDPERRGADDDWVEILVKQAVSRKFIASFEQSFEDAEVRMTYHRDNGLDGKVSSAEISTQPSGPIVDLYEGNSASQNLVCSTPFDATRTIDLTSDAHCENDEARSLTLYNFPADKVIFIYDDPSGSKGDDWTVIVPKHALPQATVASFEQSYETADLRVCSFPHNGLDGKVSRMRIGGIAEAAGICGVPALPPTNGGGGGGSTPPPSTGSPTPITNPFIDDVMF